MCHSVVFEIVSTPPEGSTTCAAHMGTISTGSKIQPSFILFEIPFLKGRRGGAVPERLSSRLEEQEEQEQGKSLPKLIPNSQRLNLIVPGTEVWSEAPRWWSPWPRGKERTEINFDSLLVIYIFDTLCFEP